MKRLLATTANIRLFTAVFTALAALSVPASAAVLDWNFQDHPGALGNSQTFSAGGFSLTARGFTGLDVGTSLFSKNAGADEIGLGLGTDPSGNDEIFGNNFIQLNMDGLLGLVNNFQFSMNSTTQGETWAVYGSQDGSPFAFTLLASGNDEGLHSLVGGYDNYNFFYTGAGPGQCGLGCNGNVLLANFEATPLATTPLPGALGFFAAGLLGLGGLVRSLRKQCGVA